MNRQFNFSTTKEEEEEKIRYSAFRDYKTGEVWDPHAKKQKSESSDSDSNSDKEDSESESIKTEWSMLEREPIDLCDDNDPDPDPDPDPDKPIDLVKNPKSKYIGVSYDKQNRWMSRICINGKTRYLGCFKTEEAAAEAYNKEAKTYNDENPTKRLKKKINIIDT